MSVTAKFGNRASLTAEMEEPAGLTAKFTGEKGGGVLLPATEERLGGIKVGSNLTITEDGILSVDTTDTMEQDNTRPITSAAVYTTVGNIEILLSTI